MKEKNKKTTYVKKDLQAVIGFLEGSMGKIIDSTRNVDNHCNVLIGLSTGIFALSLNEILQTENFHLTLMIIAGFSALSSVIALCAIRPLRFMVKRGQEESLLYPRKISSFKSAKEYSRKLMKVLETDDDIFYQYSIEIYNLSKFYYQPKRKLFAASRNIFLLGVVSSLFTLLLENYF